MRLIQHKREAFWFYRFLSLGYDRWVNPLFWTPAMRDAALAIAHLDQDQLSVVDVGAGTGFTTEGIAARVPAANVTMLDQSPHQLARSRRKASLSECFKVAGDAEALPFSDDSFDRYVSAGSIEYWPDPQRAICEAYRVVKPGGVATVIGPLPSANRVLRGLQQAWMLFPTEAEYRDWFSRAGFDDVVVSFHAPAWYRGREPYALAIAGVVPRAGASPLAASLGAVVEERLSEEMGMGRRLRFAGRFVVGSAAGLAFVPVGAALALRAWVVGRFSVAGRPKSGPRGGERA